MRQGVELRRTAHDAEALERFRRAYALAPSARVRAQVGLAEEALSDWVDAEQDIAAAAAEADPWIARNAEALAAALRDVASHLASLDVRANVEGAELWVDGSVRAKLPLPAPLRVVAGSLDVRVSAEGFEPLAEVVVLPAGGELRQTLDLHPVASPPPEPPPVPSALPEPTPAPLAIPPPTPAGSEARSATPSLAWALLASAGALVVGGVAASVVGNANAAVYDDDARCLYGDSHARPALRELPGPRRGGRRPGRGWIRTRRGDGDRLGGGLSPRVETSDEGGASIVFVPGDGDGLQGAVLTSCVARRRTRWRRDLPHPSASASTITSAVTPSCWARSSAARSARRVLRGARSAASAAA